MTSFVESTQSLGRALMLPIAVLPVAGLLLRLGQPDLLDMAFVAAAGDAIFSNLGLLFAIGVAVGIARENHGAAGLAGVVGFVVASKGAEVLIQVPPEVIAATAGVRSELALAAYKARELSKLSVPLGILSGLIAGFLYNRYANIKLPSYLAFFGGRRFVPIASGCLSRGMDALTQGVLASGEVGLFIYGVLNRLLIVTGLHHILNNVAWFLVGDFNGVTGDLKRFFAGDPSAGAFMAGFFPVMMFGLPAACLAMYHPALPERRAAVGGLLASMALTSFLTGVTEPIEFTFMFLAPALYAVHALLTGAALVTMDLLNSKLGFSFSAGLFDYVLNFNRSTHPYYLLPVGAFYFALYYGLFRYFIVRFGLKTPGRELEETAPWFAPVDSAAGGDAALALGYIAALGGAANLKSIDACTTRLRLTLADRGAIDEAQLRRLGARGVVNVGEKGVQVVVGPEADQLAGEMRACVSAAPAPSPGLSSDALFAALGGRSNVREVDAVASRIVVRVADDARIDETALRSIFVRGIARPAVASVHLLHEEAAAIAALLR